MLRRLEPGTRGTLPLRRCEPRSGAGSAFYSARTVAGQQTTRHSRKTRTVANAPRVVRSPPRELRAQRELRASRGERPSRGPQRAIGERPPGPFGGLPISELAILAGTVGIVIGLIRSGGPALIVGVIVCVLGVLEVTAREHFSGYRSHTILLAAVPAVAVEAGLVAVFGESRERGLLLLAVVPVYAIAFALLHERFQSARHARLGRLPAPPRDEHLGP